MNKGNDPESQGGGKITKETKEFEEGVKGEKPERREQCRT